jgi:hypothetical protein
MTELFFGAIICTYMLIIVCVVGSMIKRHTRELYVINHSLYSMSLCKIIMYDVSASCLLRVFICLPRVCSVFSFIKGVCFMKSSRKYVSLSIKELIYE